MCQRGAQTLTGAALVKSLQAGGHVIVMRHASSPREVPDKPNPDNVPPERQLDEKGRSTATAMGDSAAAPEDPDRRGADEPDLSRP